MGYALDRRAMLGLLAAAPVAGRLQAAGAAKLTLATRHGMVRGRVEDGIRVFTGIPYGRAARFRPALEARNWPGVLDASGPAAVAPQLPGMAPFAGRMGEDCLHLNVWAPATPGPHPVLFFIHGGANETGWSGEPLIAGDRFAADGVVCVTANYRLGALGFMELGGLLGPDYEGSANHGVRDLILALRWVRANIAAFGGDPRRITIAGESAGGKNVGTLIGMPAVDGLYARAAVFSGGGQTVHTKGQAHEFARLFAEKLGGADRLLGANVDQILAAQAAAKAAWPRNFPFRPMVDGAALPMIPLDRIRAGKAPRVPMLIGSNADESRLFLPAGTANGPLSSQSVANESMERMAALDHAYALAFPDLSDAERHWRLLTAEEYGMPCLRMAEAHARNGAPVWRYRLTYPAPGGPFKGLSPHVLDVPFTFNHLQAKGIANLFGLSAVDQPMADALHGAMVHFVAGGAPAAHGLPAWPPYHPDRRATMDLNRSTALLNDPDGKERALWGDS